MMGRGRDHVVAPNGRSSVRAREKRDRGVLRVGLLVSALLHVLLLGIIGALLERPRTPPESGDSPVYVEPPRGMRAVSIAPAPTETPAARPDPVEPSRPDREEIVVMVPSVEEEDPEDAPVPDALSAADRLAPRLVDPRLWRPVVLIPRRPTLADVQARLDAAMELLSDSALAEAERAMRAVDWTVEDADGGRWGVSPGKLHLGKLTLPLPVYFTIPGYDPERAEWYELEAQVDRTRFLENFEDRVRAIRERRDRERREGRSEDGGGVATGGGSGG